MSVVSGGADALFFWGLRGITAVAVGAIDGPGKVLLGADPVINIYHGAVGEGACIAFGVVDRHDLLLREDGIGDDLLMFPGAAALAIRDCPGGK